MSKERPITPADFLYQEQAYQERLAVISDIWNEVNAKAMSIFDERSKIEDTVGLGGALEWITATTRGAQLGALSEFVLEMAEYEDYDLGLSLDDPQLLTDRLEEIQESEFFFLNQEPTLEAFRLGETLGTNDFLEIIVPSSITNQDVRSAHFEPWVRNMLAMKYLLMNYKDGSAWIPRPTRLSNITVSYHYPPKAKLPERTIHLKHQRRTTSAPPSSPR